MQEVYLKACVEKCKALQLPHTVVPGLPECHLEAQRLGALGGLRGSIKREDVSGFPNELLV